MKYQHSLYGTTFNFFTEEDKVGTHLYLTGTDEPTNTACVPRKIAIIRWVKKAFSVEALAYTKFTEPALVERWSMYSPIRANNSGFKTVKNAVLNFIEQFAPLEYVILSQRDTKTEKAKRKEAKLENERRRKFFVQKFKKELAGRKHLILAIGSRVIRKSDSKKGVITNVSVADGEVYYEFNAYRAVPRYARNRKLTHPTDDIYAPDELIFVGNPTPYSLTKAMLLIEAADEREEEYEDDEDEDEDEDDEDDEDADEDED